MIGLGLHSTGFWLYPLGYFMQKPYYKCTFEEGVPAALHEELCTSQFICDSDSRIASWQVDMESDHSLQNWQQ